jgi:hypothetical protein
VKAPEPLEKVEKAGMAKLSRGILPSCGLHIWLLIAAIVSCVCPVLTPLSPIMAEEVGFLELEPQRDPLWIPEKFDRDWKLRIGLGRDSIRETRFLDNAGATTASDINRSEVEYSFWKQMSRGGRLSFRSDDFWTSNTLSMRNRVDYTHSFNRRHGVDWAVMHEYWNDRTQTDLDYGRGSYSMGYSFSPNIRFRTSLRNEWENLTYRISDATRPDRERNTFIWDLNYNVDLISSYLSFAFVNNTHDDARLMNNYEKRMTFDLDWYMMPRTRLEIDDELDIFQYARGDYNNDVQQNDFRAALVHRFDDRVWLELGARVESEKYDRRDDINFDNHIIWFLPKLRYSITDAFYLEGGWKLGEKEFIDSDPLNIVDDIDAWLLDERRREGYLNLSYNTSRLWAGLERSTGQREMANGESASSPDFREEKWRAYMTFHFTEYIYTEAFYDFYKRSNYTFNQYDERRREAQVKLSWLIH